MTLQDRVLCDTGTISRYLTKSNADIVHYIDNLIGLHNIVITPINRIELLNWLSGYQNLDVAKRRIYTKFIKTIPLVHINENISKIAVELVDKHINSKPADTFIGATAIYHKIPLYTLNHKDFKIFKNIILLNPLL